MSLKSYIRGFIILWVFMGTLLNAYSLSTTKGYNKFMVATSIELLSLIELMNRGKVSDTAGPNSLRTMFKKRGYELVSDPIRYKNCNRVVAINHKTKKILVLYSEVKNYSVKKAIKEANSFSSRKITTIPWLQSSGNKDLKYTSVSKNVLKEYERFKVHPTGLRSGYPVFVAGYGTPSLYAALTALNLEVNFNKDVYFYSFGSPKTGDWRFLEGFYKTVNTQFRIALNRDPIPMLPKKKHNNIHSVGNLLQLYFAGVRVPANKIKPKWKERKLEYHSLSRYKNALIKHLKHCTEKGPSCYKKGVLAYSADLERDAK